MVDKLEVKTSSALLHTGKGQLAGFILSSSSAVASEVVTFYDNTAGSGTKLLEVNVWTNYPVHIFFPERLGPIFATGLYVCLAANLTCTVWYRTV